VESDQVVRRNERAVFRELTEEEGAVLLHLDTGAYHGLNPTGTLIWDLIGEGATFGDIVDGVRARLADAPADLTQDVAAFVTDLVARDLLVVDESRS
jgi:hypothetical protein